MGTSEAIFELCSFVRGSDQAQHGGKPDDRATLMFFDFQHAQTMTLSRATAGFILHKGYKEQTPTLALFVFSAYL